MERSIELIDRRTAATTVKELLQQLFISFIDLSGDTVKFKLISHNHKTRNHLILTCKYDQVPGWGICTYAAKGKSTCFGL